LPFLTIATTTASNPTVTNNFHTASSFIHPSWRVPSKLLQRSGIELRRSTCRVPDIHTTEYSSRLEPSSNLATYASPRRLAPFRTLMSRTPLKLTRSTIPRRPPASPRAPPALTQHLTPRLRARAAAAQRSRRRRHRRRHTPDASRRIRGSDPSRAAAPPRRRRAG
jgi:hypothetical protein